MDFLKRITFVLAFLLATHVFARERGPRVEVVCPTAPIPVRMNDKRVLVYELHVTNFDVVPLTLEQLDVSGDGQAPLLSLVDSKLAATMVRVGAAMNMGSGSGNDAKDSRTIDPGARRVVYMW